MQKWQAQLEEILKKKFPDDEISEMVEEAIKVINLAGSGSIDPPPVIAGIMRQMSKELYPLAISHASFKLGVAWERLNAR